MTKLGKKEEEKILSKDTDETQKKESKEETVSIKDESSEEKLKSKKSGKKFADEVLALISLVLLFIVILAEIFTPFFVFFIAPGFIENNLKFELAIELTRITFPFLLLVSLSSFFSGILNSHNKFAVAAAAPIILNLLMIASIIFSYLYDNNYSKNLYGRKSE